MRWEVSTMRCGTSWYNATLFRKNFQRFWPIWALWGVIWAVLIPLNLYTRLQSPSTTHQDALMWTSSLGQGMSSVSAFLALGFGVMCAMAVFGYLFQHRSACMMHALPMRRETLFVTACLSGLSFLVFPLLAVAALTALIEAAFNCLEPGALLAWLAVNLACALFFFAFAVFCAMFTGNVLALPAFYGILNFLIYFLYCLIEMLADRFLYGFSQFNSGVQQAVYWLTPVIKLSDQVGWQGDQGVLEGWDVLAVYAGVGLVLLICSLLLYRSRHVETAGDVVSVPVVRPLFRFGLAVCAGLSFGWATQSVLGLYDRFTTVVCLLIWAVAGLFVAEMLLKKSFRVLYAWKQAAVLCAVLLAVCAAINADLFGYVGWVPTVQQVEEVNISMDSYPYDSGSNGGTLRDKDQIAKVLDLHQAIVNAGEEPGVGETYSYVRLTYIMADGQVISRRYDNLPLNQADLEVKGTITAAANALISDQDVMREFYGLDDVADLRVSDVYLDNLYDVQQNSYIGLYLEEDHRELWDAVLADFAEGTLGAHSLFYLDEDFTGMESRLEFTFQKELPVPDPNSPTDLSLIHI